MDPNEKVNTDKGADDELLKEEDHEEVMDQFYDDIQQIIW